MDKTAIIAIVAVSVLAVSGVALYAVNSSHNDSTTVDDSDGATNTTDDATDKFWSDMVAKLNQNGISIKIGTSNKDIYSKNHNSSTQYYVNGKYIHYRTTTFAYKNGYLILTETIRNSSGVITGNSQDWYRVTTVNTIVYYETIDGFRSTVTLHL